MNVLYIEGPSGGVAALRTQGMLSAKPQALELKVLKGDWTERSGRHVIKSWLSLSTLRKLDIRHFEPLLAFMGAGQLPKRYV